jgi:hypothetical protein
MECHPELNAMSDDEFAAVIGAADQQMAQPLARAQACLDLFEKDCGRRATTALDIRVWADVQVPENLRFRILRRVHTAEVWTEACKRIWNDIPAPLASRPPMGQRISLSLAQAAKTTGLSESTILAAIENGRIVGMKDILDGWPLERAQLCHVFPPAPAGPAKSDTVADALVARDIGFVFVTGYDHHGLLAYRDRPTLKKPFQIDALKRCCKSALSRTYLKIV